MKQLTPKATESLLAKGAGVRGPQMIEDLSGGLRLVTDQHHVTARIERPLSSFGGRSRQSGARHGKIIAEYGAFEIEVLPKYLADPERGEAGRRGVELIIDDVGGHDALKARWNEGPKRLEIPAGHFIKPAMIHG